MQIVETRIFLRGTVMKASSHEKQKNMEKQKKKTKSSDPWARSGERPGRGHGSELFGFFCFFWFFHGFLQFGQNLEKTKKNKKNKKFRPMGKVWGEAWQGTWV